MKMAGFPLRDPKTARIPDDRLTGPSEYRTSRTRFAAIHIAPTPANTSAVGILRQ